MQAIKVVRYRGRKAKQRLRRRNCSRVEHDLVGVVEFSEFLTDSILWPAKERDDSQLAGPVCSCVCGTSCLEYDVLT